ncbi:MAG: selenium cofactor biosynthesis protein YqeC [Chloroflexota bacterium]
MNLVRALRLPQLPPSRSSSLRGETISLVGAGGKTTALFQLAHELITPRTANRQPLTILTTTTHLGDWQVQQADHHFIVTENEPLPELDSLDGVILVTGPRDGDRFTPPPRQTLDHLRGHCAARGLSLLIEADGARGRPLKAPAAHEPALPDFVDTVVVAAGLGGLGKPLTEDFVHRPHLFSTLSGLPFNEPVTPEALVRVLTHPEGGLKNIPPGARRVALLNQADTPELQSIGGRMAKSLLNDFDSVVVGSLLQPSNLQTFEPIAGIILAAGASERFGQPKQLLDWRGQPFVRAVAQTALDAGLAPVIVVTGAYADGVEAALRDLPVTIVRNEGWQEGQASSIRAGIRALTPSPLSQRERGWGEGGALFLLADQPHIPVNVIQALVEHHTRELYPIVAPLVMMEQRANPVLFDRVTFSDLLTLTGDIGGRALFSKYPVEYLPWHDDRLLLDVDKPEDYQRLVEDETL